MKKYHKIQTVFKRNPETKFKTLLHGDYSLPEFEYLKNNKWVFTEKVDGTNIRIMFDGEKITYGGKTDNAQIPTFLFMKLQDVFEKKKNKLKEKFPEGVCFYGEGYGAKIQKGGGNYIKDDVSFVMFDIRIGNVWLKRDAIVEIAYEFDLEVVPIVSSGTLDDMIEICKKGFKSQWGDFNAEGLVARPEIELINRMGHRIITKLKCKDFHNE